MAAEEFRGGGEGGQIEKHRRNAHRGNVSMEEAGVWRQEWRELWATGLNMAANSKERV